MHSKNKKPVKKLLVLKWTKFLVKLRNFYYYGLILVSYKKKCIAAFLNYWLREFPLPAVANSFEFACKPKVGDTIMLKNLPSSLD